MGNPRGPAVAGKWREEGNPRGLVVGKWREVGNPRGLVVGKWLEVDRQWIRGRQEGGRCWEVEGMFPGRPWGAGQREHTACFICTYVCTYACVCVFVCEYVCACECA